VTFKDVIADHHSVFANADHFAEAVVFANPGESPISLSAVIDRAEQIDTTQVTDGLVVLKVAAVGLSAADVATPRRGAQIKVTATGELFEVTAQPGKDVSGWHTLSATLLERLEYSSDGYRQSYA